MNNKLICPFCQTELEDAGIHSAELYFCCTNCYMKQKEKDDNYTASPRIWQALIQAKQDLEIAIKGIKTLGEYDPYKEHLGIDTIAKNILEQIEHKDEQ